MQKLRFSILQIFHCQFKGIHAENKCKSSENKAFCTICFEVFLSKEIQFEVTSLENRIEGCVRLKKTHFFDLISRYNFSLTEFLNGLFIFLVNCVVFQKDLVAIISMKR